MPDVVLLGLNPPALILSGERTFAEGPAPGFVDQLFVANFLAATYTAPPNVFTTTGNPHWTTHPIWASTNAAGFVVNRKTPSPGGRTFQVYVMTIGYAATTKEEAENARLELVPVSPEEFEELKKAHTQA